MGAAAGFIALFTGFAVLAAVIATSVEAPTVKDRRAVLLTTEPVDAPAEAVARLSRFPRVDSVAALEDALDEDVNVVLVDRSALGLLDEGALAAQAEAGRAVMGINVFHDELTALTGLAFEGPTREQWLQSHDGEGEGAYYSFQYRAADGSRGGGGQKHFKDGLFGADLPWLLSGEWRE